MEKETVKMSKEELTNLLAGIAKSAVQEEIKSSKEKEVVAFNPFSSKSREDISKMDGKQKSVEFLKAVFHKDLSTLASFKAMNEGTGSAGGFVVPEEWSAEVNRVVEDFGLVPKLARRYPMKYDTLRVPRLSSSVAVSYPGEGVAGTPSQPVFAEVVLLSKTLVGLTALTNELLEDANIDVVNLLTELFAEAIAGENDLQGLVGTGAPFTGILNVAGTNPVLMTTNTFADVTPDYARDMITSVKPWSLQGASYIMHRDIWSIIQKAKASTGGDYFASASNPILGANNANQGFPTAMAGTLWGYPVYLSDKMPAIGDDAPSTKFVIFGNLKHLYMGVRKDLAVSISDQATIGADNLFEQNMSGVRVLTRNAIAVGLPACFATLETSA